MKRTAFAFLLLVTTMLLSACAMIPLLMVDDSVGEAMDITTEVTKDVVDEIEPTENIDKETDATEKQLEFSFEQTSIQVTEQDVFEIKYMLMPSNKLDLLIFEIDNPNVLRQNEDGTYTALLPGVAKVMVYEGTRICDICEVEVMEQIIPIESIIFPVEEFDVYVGSTFELDYTILPENANDTDVTIVVSNEEVLVNNGDFFYVNDEGSTTIEFYQGDRLLGACIVHATFLDAETLTFGENVEEIFVGESAELVFSLFPENATRKGIQVSSSNNKVAEVILEDGKDAAVKVIGIAAGEATLTLTLSNGSTYTHAITVKEVLPTEIKITNNRADERIEVGTKILLAVTWMPENTSLKELTWKSSNSKVVKVNPDGTVEAVGIGTADITAKHNSGVSAKISLTVEPTPVTSISLTTDQDISKKFIKGDKFTITALVFPQNATNKTVTFASSDESVVKVSNKGVVTAVNVGDAKITVTSTDGITTTLNVKVSPSPQKFKITWSASLIAKNHVGNNWSKLFEVNDEEFSSGSTFVLEPDGTFTIRLTIQDNDARPDIEDYFEEIVYSADLCKNGHTITDTLYVTENGGRYSGNSAEWKITIKIVPIK